MSLDANERNGVPSLAARSIQILAESSSRNVVGMARSRSVRAEPRRRFAISCGQDNLARHQRRE
jgi:hypothetical protein